MGCGGDRIREAYFSVSSFDIVYLVSLLPVLVLVQQHSHLLSSLSLSPLPQQVIFPYSYLRPVLLP